MNRITVDFLEDQEIDALVSLAEKIWYATYPGLIPEAQIRYMLDQRYAPDVLCQQRSQGHPLLVARVATELVGFAHVFLEEPQCRLDKLYVDPAYQGHGVGRLLVTHAGDYAASKGCSTMMLRVNRHNTRAIQAYHRYGFEVIATRCEDIGSGFVMDDLVFLKTLSLSR